MGIEEFLLSLMTAIRAILSPNLEMQTSLEMGYPDMKGVIYLASKTPSSSEKNTTLNVLKESSASA